MEILRTLLTALKKENIPIFFLYVVLFFEFIQNNFPLRKKKILKNTSVNL